MSYFYAVIDGDGRVTGRSQLASQVSENNMIPIDSLDQDLTGKLWDGTAWVDDMDPPAPPVRMRLTKREFRNQFTFAEKQAIYTAAEASVDIRIFLDDLQAAEYIDCDNAETVASVNALESSGLIGTGRADEILAGVTD
jgi:hypothetical protein